MVNRNVFRWGLATLTLLGASTVSAAPINFTGHVAQDFNSVADKSIKVIDVNPDPLNRIVQMPEMTAQGIINGYALKDIRLKYDFDSDTLSVGLNTYSIAGNAIGNGGPDLAKLLTAQGGQDPADVGGRKSISLGFAGMNRSDLSKVGQNLIVAGIPSDKAHAGTGLIGFTVATLTGNSNSALQHNYGTALPSHTGALAFKPSAEHPGFEFTITNFSKISPEFMDPKEGFWIKAYLGSPDDTSIGEEATAWMKIPAFSPEVVPEPATWLAWSVAAATIGGCRLRRRSKV